METMVALDPYLQGGVVRWAKKWGDAEPEPKPVLNYRESLGSVLRDERTKAGLRLRDFPGVSIGHVSEVERGMKECSSEVLEVICSTLNLSISDLLRRTADLMDQ